MLSSQDVNFFISVAGSHSLAAAARKLNVTPPSVSQRLQHIEAKLGVKLVERSARSISLTEAGQIFAEKGLSVIQGLEALHQDICHQNLALSGNLKIVSSMVFGIKHIAPIAAEFQQQYPNLSIELELSDTPKWSVHNSPDILFYIGHLQDSSLRRIVLAKNRRLLLASPQYLQAAEEITTPLDLQKHKCIVIRENEEDATMWQFTHAETNEAINVRVDPSLCSNSGQVIKDWCLQGGGIMQRSQWDVQSELATGELVQIMPKWQLATADIVALVSSKQAHRLRKVSYFLEYTKQSLAKRIP